MIVLFALVGLAVSWLLEPLGDYLVRLTDSVENPPSDIRIRPALWRLVSREKLQGFAVAQLALELLSAVVFGLIYSLHGVSGNTLVLLVVYTFFALITLIDLKYRLVLNVLTYPAIVIALVVNLVVLQQPPLPILLGVAFGFGIFYLTARVMPNGMGGGDIKLAALIGAALGFPYVLFALIVMAVASAITIAVMLAARKTRKDSIPYAPFLCLGVVVVLIYSSMLVVA